MLSDKSQNNEEVHDSASISCDDNKISDDTDHRSEEKVEPEMNNKAYCQLAWLKNDPYLRKEKKFHENLSVEIVSFEKIGEGMSAYILFTIRTTTNMPIFRSTEMTVRRRFSDFLGLYQRLYTTHSSKGILVPPPPDKQNIDSNKFKFVKDIAKENEFLEQRRVSLLHFLENLIRHPVLRTDSYLREFLEFDGLLPKSTNTQTISSSSASKWLKTFTDTIAKISAPMDDTDEYFFGKFQQLSNINQQFTRLMNSFNTLSINKLELSNSLVNIMHALEQLSLTEQANKSSLKIEKLTRVYDEIGKYESVRAQAESVYLCEMTRSIVSTINASKNLLGERTKSIRKCKEREEILSSKRAQKVKLELSGKLSSEKVNFYNAQIQMDEQNLEDSKQESESISRTIKAELVQFDEHRFYDLRAAMLAYLQVLLGLQRKNLEAWCTYLNSIEAITC